MVVYRVVQIIELAGTHFCCCSPTYALS